MNKANRIRLAIIAFGIYFLSGSICAIVGSLLNELMTFYNKSLREVVLLVSAFALGRVLTVYFTGRAVEKHGPLKVLFITSIMAAAYLGLLSLIQNYYIGLCLAFIGGIGMGGQDAACPLLLSETFKDDYAASLSAGQGLYCFGNFAFAFIVGFTKSLNISYRYAFMILLAISLLVIFLIPFSKAETKTIEGEDTVKPLYTNNKKLVYIVTFLFVFLYCVFCNNCGTYTSSYIDYLGYDFGAYVFTTYNAGCLIGAFAFIYVLRKISERLVLFINCAVSFVCLVLAVLINRPTAWFILYFIIGFLLGVLFSLIISVITRVGYKQISLLSSLVGVIGGCGDILTPIFTGGLIEKYSLTMSTNISIVVLFVLTILSLITLLITKEENIYGYSE